MLSVPVLKRYVNTHNGYVRLYLANSKVVEEHRYLLTQHMGRELEKNECVHHKDGDKHNNSIANLELLSPAEHAAHHSILPTTVSLQCSGCSKTFNRRRNQVVTKIKYGQTDFYCNRSCMATTFGRGRAKTRTTWLAS